MRIRFWIIIVESVSVGKQDKYEKIRNMNIIKIILWTWYSSENTKQDIFENSKNTSLLKIEFFFFFSETFFKAGEIYVQFLNIILLYLHVRYSPNQ